MRKQKTREVATAELRTKIWALRAQCWTYERIAKEVGVSQLTVSYHIRKEAESYLERHLAKVDVIKAEQVHSLSTISDEAFQAWEKSKSQRRQTNKPLLTIDENGEVQEPEKETGDPRYLLVAIKAKEDIRKIIGLDAAIRSQVAIANIAPPKDIDPATPEMTLEEAQRVYQNQLAVGKQND